MVTSYKDIPREQREEYGRQLQREIENKWQKTVQKARVYRSNKQEEQLKKQIQRGNIYKTVTKKKVVQFINRETDRINTEVKKVSGKIPTLRDINIAGYKYAQKHPTSARIMYNSMDEMARVVRKVVPKEAGIPIAKSTYAFADGTLKGVRNEPIKTLAYFALPGVAGAAMKGARYVPVASKIVKSEKAMKAVAGVLGIAYTHDVYTRVNAPVLSRYKKGAYAETYQTQPNGSIKVTTNIEMVPVTRKPTTSEKAERLGYIYSTEVGPMAWGAVGVNKISKIRFKELSKKGVRTTKKTVKTIKKPSEIKKYISNTKAKRVKTKKIKETRKRIAKAEKMRSPKVVKLHNTVYTKVNKLSKQKAKIKALIKKIRQIPASIAKELGINKNKEIKRLTILMRETDTVKSYMVMIQKGSSKKIIVKHIAKLPENKLEIIDTKTGKLIKEIDKNINDIELKVIKPSKKPPSEYKEVRVGKGQVQLQKTVQKQKIKTVQLKKQVQKQKVKTVVLVEDVKKLNVKTKQALKTKPKTKQSLKLKQKQLTKIKTKLKTRQRTLILYRSQLLKYKSKYIQLQKTIQKQKVKTVQKQKTIAIQVPVQKSVLKSVSKTITEQIHIIDTMLKQIVDTELITRTVLKDVTKVITIVPPPIPTIYKSKKKNGKRRRVRTKTTYEDWYVKNIIPTLKSIYG